MVVLTVNRRAELGVQDAESYQKLLEAKDRIEAIEGIKRGLESMKRNAGKPKGKFFQELFIEKGISERANENTYAVVFEDSSSLT